MYYIYILYSPSFDKYYVGYTQDYNQRLVTHNTTDKNTFTSKYRPWRIETVFGAGEDEAKAIHLERFIKKQKSRKLLLHLIDGKELKNELAQLVRVPHLRD